MDVGVANTDRKSGIASVLSQYPERRRRIVLAAVIGFLLGAAGLWLAVPGAPRHGPLETPSGAAALAPASGAATPPLPQPGTSSSATATTEMPVEPVIGPPTVTPPPPHPTASASASAKPRPPASRQAKPKPAAKTDCDPPYTIDQDGHRHYKMECL